MAKELKKCLICTCNEENKYYYNYYNLKRYANLFEGRCFRSRKRGGSIFLSSKVTMATEPQFTSEAPVNTSLRKTSV